MSDLGTLIAAQSGVVGQARKVPLPDELRDLPRQAQARLDALLAVDTSTAGTPVVRVSPLEAALENAIAAAYAAVQKIDDEKTLRVVAQVMAGDGQSLALLRQSMNREPVPSAFETGKAP